MVTLGIDGFIKKSRKVHGHRYSYSLVNYINNSTKVVIVCRNHGEFLQRPDAHLLGQGCQKCVGNKKLTTGEFISKARIIHNNNYNYSEVDYINAKTKVNIICKKHGNFKQNPEHHLCGCGCPKCGNEKTIKITTSNTKDFIQKVKRIHRNKYDYSSTNYINSHIKVNIICKKHGGFLQSPTSHLSGADCPKCNNDKISKRFKNKCKSKNHKINLRLASINRIKQNIFNGGQMIPGYNPKACEYIDDLNKKNKWNLQHAMNGGEFFIKKLGYWVDGYDKDKNVIFEYDEPSHYRKKEKDNLRQTDIINYFKNKNISISFWRYDERYKNLYEVTP